MSLTSIFRGAVVLLCFFSTLVIVVVRSAGTAAQSDVPTTGLSLWLKADAGVKLSGDKVSVWTDQSKAQTDARQDLEASQPTYVISAVNGRPALYFNGLSEFMTFKLPLNGLTAMSIVLVSAAVQNADGSWNGVDNAPLFWNETSSWGTVHLSPFQDVVRYRFGTGQVNNLPRYNRPATIDTSYSLTTAIKNGSNESLFVNGAQVLAQSGKLASISNVQDVGALARGYNDNSYFWGYISEVLVYARALSDSERQQIETYLKAKYALSDPVVINQPPTVSAGPDQTITLPGSANLRGTVTDQGLPSNSVSVTWTQVSGPGTVAFVNSHSDSTSASFSKPGIYVLQLAATDGTLQASSECTVNVQSLNDSSISIPAQNLRLWLRGDAGVVLNGSRVSQWTDQSGTGSHATQTTTTAQPTFISSAINGKPGLQFDGVSNYLNFTLPVGGLSAMTIALVGADAQDKSSNSEGSYSPLYWPETTGWGMLYVNPLQRYLQWRFGTGQSLDLPTYNRPVSLGRSYSLTTVVKNGATENAYVNGQSVLSRNDALPTIADVADNGYLGRCTYTNTFFSGSIAEILVYTRALTDVERRQVEQYLMNKYFSAATNEPPMVNAGADQTIALPATASLQGTASDDGLPLGNLTTTWTRASGPGTVSFGDVNALTTTAVFSTPGTYVLQLTASDGSLNSTSDVTITASADTASGGTPPGGSIVINPGDDIQSAVNSHNPGATYYLQAGVYRMQSISPHSGDTFIGAAGAALNGSKVIPNAAFTVSGGHWIAAGQMPSGIAMDPNTAAPCISGYPRCQYLNELFRDGVRLTHVGGLSSLATGTWYFDNGSKNIVVYDNPAGHMMEMSMTTSSFPASSAANVTLKNLIIEQYANPSQHGAVDCQSSWTLDGDEVRWNHGSGARVGSYAKLLNNYIHHNGQMGLTGQGMNLLVEGNEIALNDAAGYDYAWEGGSTKHLRTTNLVVRNNYLHDNRGPGLWNDYENWYALFESNRIVNGFLGGIDHELSFDITVRYNYIENTRQVEWAPNNSLYYGAGILSANSRRMNIHHNTVVNAVNGIGAQNQARPGTSPTSGETFRVSDFNVHDNVIVQMVRGNGVAAGILNATYDPVYSSMNNRYTNNTYKLYDVNAPLYQWAAGLLTKDQWKAAGNDTTGTWIDPAANTFPSTTFSAGDRVKTTANTSVWSLPSTSEGTVGGVQAKGSLGTITKVRGPILDGGTWWWQIDFDSGSDGWCPESAIVKN